MIACEKCGYTSAGVMVGFQCPQMTCDGRIVVIKPPTSRASDEEGQSRG